jgi:hypothetical protein
MGGVPATGVSAVVMNVTVTEPSTAGYLAVVPGINLSPISSSLNWSRPNATVANHVTSQVSSDGRIAFHNGSSGRVQVIADTAGYFIE